MFGMLLLVLSGCSDDDNPTGSNPPPAAAAGVVSVLDSATGIWTTTADASEADSPASFLFADALASGKPAAAWDIRFARSNINLNGGASADGGSVVAADLGGATAFEDVTIADTAGLSWVEDDYEFIISDWLADNPATHELDMTRFVYSMTDAGGSNYVKLRIDSLVGAAQPPNMGTVWISYYFQSNSGSLDLSGAIETASITVGSGAGYFDFSTASQVTPTSPTNSSEWDICFSNYNVKQNSGPNGIGDCAAFPAYGELTDSTDLQGFSEQPGAAPMFPDFISSVFNGSLTDDDLLWYDYDPTTHRLSSKSHVYLIRVGDDTFKFEIISYYADVNGTLTSGHYTLIWKQL